MIYKKIPKERTSINTSKFMREGQSIEQTMRIATANKEQAVAMLPEIYQKRNEGIDPICDIRTDKFQLAQDAMDKVTRAHLLAHQNKDKMGKERDNSWITDEEGNPMYEPVTPKDE